MVATGAHVAVELGRAPARVMALAELVQEVPREEVRAPLFQVRLARTPEDRREAWLVDPMSSHCEGHLDPTADRDP